LPRPSRRPCSLAGGGRLVYVGAGTSGGSALDSVELYRPSPWPKDRALGLLAGGQQAMFEAVEGRKTAWSRSLD